MADPEPRDIDWGTAEIQDATLTVDLSGASSKVFKQRFERVLALLDTPHSHWGKVRIGRKAIQVAAVQQGAEAELRHFLESVVLQANSELTHHEQSAHRAVDETPEDETARADRQMTAAFRAFADESPTAAA
jgi:hypothetical protein